MMLLQRKFPSVHSNVQSLVMQAVSDGEVHYQVASTQDKANPANRGEEKILR